MSPHARAIIVAINDRIATRWSLGELSQAAGASRTATWGILDNLRRLRLVRHLPEARGWRRWEVTGSWRRRTLETVLSDYEWASKLGSFIAAEKSVERIKP